MHAVKKILMYTTDTWDCDCSDGLIWDKSVIGNRISLNQGELVDMTVIF